MTRDEQLAEVKKALNVTGTALDNTLSSYLDEVKLYMSDAGVDIRVVNAQESIGCICRGVADLYIERQLSQYFYQRLSQLALYEGHEDE